MKFLLSRALIKVTGSDSENFLQSQFSNNIAKVSPEAIQVNTYCQHQGKIISIIWVFKRKDNFYLSIPENLKEIVLSRLKMFKLMSKVEIVDLSSSEYQYGLIDEKNENELVIRNNLSILITNEFFANNEDINLWEEACINNTLPEIYIQTSEKFTPQLLNLDIDEFGVSFSKGCYPGQEVIARMHYLGKPKRKLFRFTSKFEVFVGDSLDVEKSESLKSSGQVIRVAKKGSEFHFLGVFDLRHIKDQIFLNNDKNKSVTIIHD